MLFRFVQPPLDMSEICDQKKLLLASIENISLSESFFLKPEKMEIGLIKGTVHMSNMSCPACFFTGTLRCYTRQCFVVRSGRTVFNNAHMLKNIAPLRRMLYVNNTA